MIVSVIVIEATVAEMVRMIEEIIPQDVPPATFPSSSSDIVEVKNASAVNTDHYDNYISDL